MPAEEVTRLRNVAVVGQGGAGKTTVADALLFAAGASSRLGRVDTTAEPNAALLEKYLEGTELTADELREGLREATRGGKILPGLCGAAGRAIGLHPLLDAIVDLLPSPAELPPWKGDNPKTGEEVERAADPTAPFAAYVFKTIVDPFAGKLAVLRVVSGRIHADLNCVNTARDVRERIGHPLKLEGKKQVQIPSAVAGDIVTVAKLKETASGDTLADEKSPIVFPPLPDTPAAISFALQPKSKADDEKVMQGLHRLMEEDTALRVHRDEQTKEFVVSGTGQLHLEVAVERLKRKFGAEVELKAPLYSGSSHDVDSSEMSFKIAARLAFKAAFEQCRPCLLEPIMTITITVPGEFMGDVIGDLNSRRGKVLGAEPKGSTGQQMIRAHVPMAEVLRYAPDLRSMTSGRGDFELEFSHYEEAPPHIAEKIIKQAQAAKAERHA